jgi:2-polyprenyl-6-methoxyphenol hydroxylase-like FAD-dependent oxidoreductase
MLIDRMPPDTVQFNKRIAKYEVLQKNNADDPAVRIHFVDGTCEEADILIAADGIKSTIRQQMLSDLLPEEQLKPRFTNTVRCYEAYAMRNHLAERICRPSIVGWYRWRSWQQESVTKPAKERCF